MNFDQAGNAIRMSVERVSAQSSARALLSLEAARDYLRVDHEAEDTAIAGMVAAARDRVESDSGRILLPETLDVRLDAFPADGVIWLPVAPVRSVVSVSVLDAAFAASAVSASVYVADLVGGQPRILPAPNGAGWPTVGATARGVVVRVEAGYAGASSVPAGLVEALKLATAAHYARGAAMPIAYYELIRLWGVPWQ